MSSHGLVAHKQLSIRQFRFINNLSGWIVFAIAALVYLLTIEPTASFWDCGEFIASGYKLEVGHPCGAPFFMLMVRLFTMFAPSPQAVPVLANSLSALASAFTILFLFWSISHLARKFFQTNEQINEQTLDLTHVILIIAAAALGALAYTFSDTFWFSAVEGEVYATSSLFTALVFWMILKWEECADQPYANRWIILIAYLMGLSIGVHLLNLLAIPAIVLVFYFKKYPFSFKGVFLALLLSGVILLTVMYGIIQGLVLLASKFELLFVNGLHMPLMSGVLIFCALLIVLIAIGLVYTYRKQKVVLNTVLLSLTVILIGYSSYVAVVVRSSANPPMDQNSPDNMFSLLYYLNREQYGDRPLLYGPSFSAIPDKRVNGAVQYAPKDGRYVPVRQKSKMKYDSRFEMVFPRMYSGSDQQHVGAYRYWSRFKGKPVRVVDQNNKPSIVYTPTMAENLRFFFRYQLGFMYMRYFMWNFSGRQNDLQGHGDCIHGNWISGLGFIDNARLGPQDQLPDTLKNNKAHNRYFMLPLLFGLVGLIYQLCKRRYDFWVVMALFFMTGIAIVMYLNQTPYQPRERDYAYAGSFYAFSIWIGFAVMAIFELVKKITKHPSAAFLVGVMCLGVPAQMAAQNWDDHDRSHSFLPVDFGYNMLIGCKPNAVLFTYGDNDTFPLWYNQEVENVRTDVRVANLSYLQGDWYIEQMQKKNYESDPLPLTTTFDKYFNSKRDLLLVYDRIKEPIDLKDAVNFMLSDDPACEVQSPFDQDPRARSNYLPSSKLFLPINREQVLRTKTVDSSLQAYILDTMHWAINKRILTKNAQVVLDLLATSNWTRPIYYGTTVNPETYFGLNKFFNQEGLNNRIVPVDIKRVGKLAEVNIELMYQNLMEKYRFRELNNPKVYFDETKTRMLRSYRDLFGRLANACIDAGQTVRAEAVLDRCLELIPTTQLPFGYLGLALIQGYYRTGNEDRAVELSLEMADQAAQNLHFLYHHINRAQRDLLDNDVRMHLAILQRLKQMAVNLPDQKCVEPLANYFDQYYDLWARESQQAAGHKR